MYIIYLALDETVATLNESTANESTARRYIYMYIYIYTYIVKIRMKHMIYIE